MRPALDEDVAGCQRLRNVGRTSLEGVNKGRCSSKLSNE